MMFYAIEQDLSWWSKWWSKKYERLGEVLLSQGFRKGHNPKAIMKAIIDHLHKGSIDIWFVCQDDRANRVVKG